MERIGKILKKGNYQGYVILEYEDESPYERIPDALAALKQAL
jgi:sugar phosphate isomerase/epimerase